MKSKQKNGYPKAQEKQTVIAIGDMQVLNTLSGHQDEHLKAIERELDIKVGHAHEGIILAGQDTEVDLAEDLILQLKGLVERGESIYGNDISRSLKLLAGNKELKLEELFRDKININGRKHSIVPKTPRQKEYLEAIRTHDMVFGVGPAGTGKTYLAMSMAVSALLNKDVKRIVLTRPAVEAGEKLGFLPGDMAEKVNPYLRPLYDALHDMVEFERAKELVEKGVIEVAPLAFMRGRTLADAFVILDEAQNTTAGQMKMFLTRLGYNSKCVVTGDPTQIDLPRGITSGLVDAVNVLRMVKGLSFVYFGEEDVIRHPLVAKIVNAYGKRKDSSEG